MSTSGLAERSPLLRGRLQRIGHTRLTEDRGLPCRAVGLVPFPEPARNHILLAGQVLLLLEHRKVAVFLIRRADLGIVEQRLHTERGPAIEEHRLLKRVLAVEA